MSETKKCCRCSESKLLMEFHVDKNKKDGRSGWCGQCTRNHHETLRQTRIHPADCTCKAHKRRTIKVPEGFKWCTKCEDVLVLSEFNRRGKGFDTICRGCKHRYFKRYYRKNGQAISHAQVLRNIGDRERARRWVWDYLLKHPCACGETDPVVLEFNHRDRASKRCNVANLVGQGSLRGTQAEVAKCDVMCANCHRRHTAKQMGWHKHNYGAVV